MDTHLASLAAAVAAVRSEIDKLDIAIRAEQQNTAKLQAEIERSGTSKRDHEIQQEAALLEALELEAEIADHEVASKFMEQQTCALGRQYAVRKAALAAKRNALDADVAAFEANSAAFCETQCMDKWLQKESSVRAEQADLSAALRACLDQLRALAGAWKDGTAELAALQADTQQQTQEAQALETETTTLKAQISSQRAFLESLHQALPACSQHAASGSHSTQQPTAQGDVVKAANFNSTNSNASGEMNKEAESVGQKQEQGDGQAEDGQGGDEQAVDEQAGEAAGMVQLGVEVAALAAEAQAAEHALRQARGTAALAECAAEAAERAAAAMQAQLEVQEDELALLTARLKEVLPEMEDAKMNHHYMRGTYQDNPMGRPAASSSAGGYAASVACGQMSGPGVSRNHAFDPAATSGSGKGGGGGVNGFVRPWQMQGQRQGQGAAWGGPAQTHGSSGPWMQPHMGPAGFYSAAMQGSLAGAGRQARPAGPPWTSQPGTHHYHTPGSAGSNSGVAGAQYAPPEFCAGGQAPVWLPPPPPQPPQQQQQLGAGLWSNETGACNPSYNPSSKSAAGEAGWQPNLSCYAPAGSMTAGPGQGAMHPWLGLGQRPVGQPPNAAAFRNQAAQAPEQLGAQKSMEQAYRQQQQKSRPPQPWQPPRENRNANAAAAAAKSAEGDEQLLESEEAQSHRGLSRPGLSRGQASGRDSPTSMHHASPAASAHAASTVSVLQGSGAGADGLNAPPRQFLAYQKTVMTRSLQASPNTRLVNTVTLQEMHRPPATAHTSDDMSAAGLQRTVVVHEQTTAVKTLRKRPWPAADTHQHGSLINTLADGTAHPIAAGPRITIAPSVIITEITDADDAGAELAVKPTTKVDAKGSAGAVSDKDSKEQPSAERRDPWVASTDMADAGIDLAKAASAAGNDTYTAAGPVKQEAKPFHNQQMAAAVQQTEASVPFQQAPRKRNTQAMQSALGSSLANMPAATSAAEQQWQPLTQPLQQCQQQQQQPYPGYAVQGQWGCSGGGKPAMPPPYEMQPWHPNAGAPPPIAYNNPQRSQHAASRDAARGGTFFGAFDAHAPVPDSAGASQGDDGDDGYGQPFGAFISAPVIAQPNIQLHVQQHMMAMPSSGLGTAPSSRPGNATQQQQQQQQQQQISGKINGTFNYGANVFAQEKSAHHAVAHEDTVVQGAATGRASKARRTAGSDFHNGATGSGLGHASGGGAGWGGLGAGSGASGAPAKRARGTSAAAAAATAANACMRLTGQFNMEEAEGSGFSTGSMHHNITGLHSISNTAGASRAAAKGSKGRGNGRGAAAAGARGRGGRGGGKSGVASTQVQVDAFGGVSEWQGL